MGEFVELTASDGFKLKAWKSTPVGKPRGGMVVIQEIFGVNHHIRDVTDRYAALGYLAIAPAIFDRYQRDFEVGYTPDDIAKARAFMGSVDFDKVVLDTEAARQAVASAGKVGIVGYCFGGTAAWLGATRLDFAAASGYYGGNIVKYKTETPKCPVILHVGSKDANIMATLDEVKAAHPEVPYYVYEGAGHGFSCNERESFDAASHDLALIRTYELFSKAVG